MNFILMTLGSWEWLGILLARLAVGMLFAITGGGKLFVQEKKEKMRETMHNAGIPLPDFNAVFVSTVEFVGGILLILGLLTPVASLLLSVVMIVAILMVKLKSIEGEGVLGWLGEFLFIPDVLYLIILVWLFFSGPGRVSLDYFLFSAV